MKTAAMLVLAGLSLGAAEARAAVREFRSVNIEFKGAKVWTPSTFIVKRGDAVRITLVNEAPSGVHGFAIEGHEDRAKVQVSNTPGDNTRVVEFQALKPGIFRIYCHMHPAHAAGQLLVLE